MVPTHFQRTVRPQICPPVRSTTYDTASAPPFRVSTPAAPTLSVPTTLYVVENVSPLDNCTAIPVSFHPAHPTTVEDRHIPSTSLD